MDKLNVFSEIGRLKTVLLHEPSEELDNLTPKYLQELLFDDIPWLPLAKKEHQAFRDAFINANVKVVYLSDLVTEALDTSLDVRNEFIHEFIQEADIKNDDLSLILEKYLKSIKDTKTLVKKTMSGIKKTEVKSYSLKSLADYIGEYPFLTDPMPNLYFTRDPFSIIGCGVSLNKMYSSVRSRETIYGKYIFKYHPIYKNTPLYFNRENKANIEGGDILVLNKETIIVGVSQRTSPSAVEVLAKNILIKQNTSFKNVLVFTIPNHRTFMHLDTIFTQVDIDKFTIHKECYKTLKIFILTKSPTKDSLIIKKETLPLEKVLERYTGNKVTLIPCGGDDSVSADREQWSDGSNTICIAPGEVIAYERNYITNKVLESYGIKVYTIPSSELSRGRGGPRCMSMPLERENI
ncbi:arginine deiminase [bacterium]|nr:arginine deiminase [bacterium]